MASLIVLYLCPFLKSIEAPKKKRKENYQELLMTIKKLQLKDYRLEPNTKMAIAIKK